MVDEDDNLELYPVSMPVEPEFGPHEQGLLFRDDVVESWDVWLKRFESHMYPVFARHGYSRDAALVAFLTNLAYSALCDIRGNTRDAADALEQDSEDDWGPGASPKG